MVDNSDDDGDFKSRRDKFRSERRSGYEGGGGANNHSPENAGGASVGRREWREARPGPPPGAWGGRSGGGERGGREGYGGGGGGGYRRDRYSPPRGRSDLSPPAKRMRGGGDWEDRYHGSGGGNNYRGNDDYERPPRGFLGRPSILGGAPSSGGQHDDSVQPPMMSFKAFLGTQEDSISDEEAIKKYAEYKLEFKRQQLNEFFVNHKDEEWFKLKYHPEDSVKRREEQKASLLKRVEVFTNFWNDQIFQSASVDGDLSDKLVRILDSVVIMLEGGTEADLKILDIEEQANAAELLKKTEPGSAKSSAGEVEGATKEMTDEGVKSEIKVEGDGEESSDKASISEEQLELQKKAKEYLEAKGGEGKSKKRKREKDDDDSGSESSAEDDDEELPPGKEKKEETENSTKENEREEEVSKDVDMTETGVVKDEDEKKDEIADNGVAESRPRALHRTASIFLRNLAPTITKQEVEAICKRYPGFLRASIADPSPDRRWFRRGWVTFERDVKIKEICYNLNNIRLREFEIGPIVNRDLTKRIRLVNAITADKKVVRNDIKMAAKVITNLDRRWGLWQKEAENGTSGEVKQQQNSEDEMIGLGSSNPVLNNITDYMIEEASAEEEELLGKNSELEDGEEGEEGNSITRDEELIRVLDRMLFYLRVVHSVDFYNHSEYPNEDEMPNRCGIMHARSPPTGSNVTQTEIDEYCSTFEKKMGSFLQPRAILTDDDAGKLGMKNEDDEVEKFVAVNTQELGKDKWLCPLSGKKFKGPDFVRKHIFNKHAEKVEEVKKEVQYYNNYLKDPKRPQLPENPQNKSSGGGSGGGSLRREAPAPHMRSDHPTGFPREATSYPVYEDNRRDNRGYNEPRYGGGGDRGYRGNNRRPDAGGYGGRGRIRDRVGPHPALRYNDGGGYGGGRPIITYRDLDAPRDGDDF